MLVRATNLIPPNASDLLERAWPLLFVIIGLNMILVERVRFGNWLALGLSLGILGGVIFLAYDTQAKVVRDDYVETIPPIPLGDHIQGLTVRIEMQAATVAFIPTLDASRSVGANFRGSTESRLRLLVQEQEGGIVEFVIQEERPNQIPDLRAYGRGHLDVFLPLGIPITELSLLNQSGGVRVELQNLEVPRFDLQIERGNVDLYLPAQANVLDGNIRIQDGSLRVLADPQRPLRIRGQVGGEINLNPNNYVATVNEGVESRGGVQNFQYELQASLPKGDLIILAPEELGQ
jgi:hypothetical protein